MKNSQNVLQDLAEIRSMMERTTKFVSLSGWAGICAGIYALVGSYLASTLYDFHPDRYNLPSVRFLEIWWIVAAVLIAALVSAFLFSWFKADKSGKSIKNSVSRRMLAAMMVPLISGGMVILLLITQDLGGLAMPLSLLFYGFHYTMPASTHSARYV